MELFTRHNFRWAGFGGVQRMHGRAALALGLALTGAAWTAQPAAAAPSCTPIDSLPAYTPASCLGQTQEQDDGLLETERRYQTSHRAETVRRFFERSFARNGWAVVATKHDIADGEFDYRLAKGQRTVKLEVDARDLEDGGGTRITMLEIAPLGPVGCAPIGGIPAYTPATCTDYSSEVDDGVPEARAAYTTGHGVDAVRPFFERAAPAAGWTLLGTDHDPADGEWQYIYGQAGRILEIEIDQSFGVNGPITRIKLTTKG